MLLPAGSLLEKLAIRLVPDAQRREETSELDARLLATPALALGQARNVAGEMAACAVRAVPNGRHSTDAESISAIRKTVRIWLLLPFLVSLFKKIPPPFFTDLRLRVI